jgi:hypothetical protein
MKHILLALICIFTVSCGSKKDANNKDSKQNRNVEEFHLVTFSTIPSDIDGCSCYFFLSKRDEERKDYILINDFGNMLFAKIDSSFTRFELLKHDSGKETFHYTSSKYLLTISILEKKDEHNENSRIKAKLSITNKDSTVHFSTEIFGMCGC